MKFISYTFSKNNISFYIFNFAIFEYKKTSSYTLQNTVESTRTKLKFFNIPIYNSNHITLHPNTLLDTLLDTLYKNFTFKQWNQSFSMQKSIGNTINNDPDIDKKIFNLCKNLDISSKQCVCKIINRLKNIDKNPNYQINYSDEEKNELNKITNSFFTNIFKVKNNIWCYNGYFLPIKQFEISVFWHKHGMHVFNKKTLNKIKHLDIIDVGGFIGDSAIIFEQEFTEKFVYTFEASEKNYNLMLKTLKLNQSQRIKPIKKALGSKNETLSLNISGYSSSFKYNDHSTENEQVEIVSLDSYIQNNDVNIGLIKVDIEGFEQEFLKGALHTIKKHKPAMIISIYHNYEDFFEIKNLIDSWNLGYSFKIYKPIDFYISLETCLYCEIIEDQGFSHDNPHQ
ncbi:FkbM family methyltransferase [Campylobacter lari]|uniref:FkbM family methyltransferase n=1 Tax=Campylobacter lari TaxID=201 RepID=UPI00215224D0|nr:FkbM family methyltransferase [Campylobacter lari]MCR6548501.1 FkbM family methyltransferase [Campylobacter lari]MCR6549933.1 FkbM family methyltransferase [Campylobacter lari]